MKTITKEWNKVMRRINLKAISTKLYKKDLATQSNKVNTKMDLSTKQDSNLQNLLLQVVNHKQVISLEENLLIT